MPLKCMPLKNKTIPYSELSDLQKAELRILLTNYDSASSKPANKLTKLIGRLHKELHSTIKTPIKTVGTGKRSFPILPPIEELLTDKTLIKVKIVRLLTEKFPGKPSTQTNHFEQKSYIYSNREEETDNLIPVFNNRQDFHLYHAPNEIITTIQENGEITSETHFKTYYIHKDPSIPPALPPRPLKASHAQGAASALTSPSTSNPIKGYISIDQFTQLGIFRSTSVPTNLAERGTNISNPELDKTLLPKERESQSAGPILQEGRYFSSKRSIPVTIKADSTASTPRSASAPANLGQLQHQSPYQGVATETQKTIKNPPSVPAQNLSIKGRSSSALAVIQSKKSLPTLHEEKPGEQEHPPIISGGSNHTTSPSLRNIKKPTPENTITPRLERRRDNQSPTTSTPSSPNRQLFSNPAPDLPSSNIDSASLTGPESNVSFV